MFATLKAVRPHLRSLDHFYEFEVDVEFQGHVRSISGITAEELFDQHAFTVAVAEHLGCPLRRETDWRQVLAEAWRLPQAWEDDFVTFDEDEEIILTDDVIPMADGEAA